MGRRAINPKNKCITKENVGELEFVTGDAIAALYGMSPGNVSHWYGKGCPKTLRLSAVVQWRESYQQGLLTAAKQKNVATSPQLERYRSHKADSAELDVLERTADLVSLRQLREALSASANIIKEAGEKLQRQYGREAREILVEAAQVAEAAIDQVCKEYRPPTAGKQYVTTDPD